MKMNLNKTIMTMTINFRAASVHTADALAMIKRRYTIDLFYR